MPWLHIEKGAQMNFRPPSSWGFCALKCLLFKEGIRERKNILTKCLVNTHLLKEVGQPSLSDKARSWGAPCLLPVSHLSREAGKEEAAR